MARSNGIGPLVLAGSGEYTETMDLVDSYLLERVAGAVLLIATACAQEGEERMSWWEQLGVDHFRRLGVEATPLRICDSEDADRQEYAEQIAEAGYVWFSGGSAAYLAQAFAETKSWQALEAMNARGGAVAGASGGLGVLNPHLANASAFGPTGLGLAAPVRAMSHFDRLEARRPEILERALASLEPGQTIVGVDEDTAIVWSDGAWRAMGHKRVQLFERGNPPLLFGHGDAIEPLPPPLRHTLVR